MLNKLTNYCIFGPLILLFLCNLSDAEVEKPVVKIGVIVPLTGGLATRGNDVSILMKVMKNHLDASSLKYRYEFILEDGKCGAGNATTSAVMKLVNIDKINYLITGCSGETLQAGPIAEKNKILTIAVLSLHHEIKYLGDYIFRNFVDSEKSFTAFAGFMDQDSQGRIAILTEENAFTFGIRDLLVKNLGEKIVYSDDFPADTGDFGAMLLKIKQKKANGVYFNVMSEGTLANLVNQAKRQGLTQKIYSYNMPEIPSFREATGSNSDNIFFIGTPEFKHELPAFRKVQEDFFALDLKGPSYEFLVRTTYDAVIALVDATEQVGPDSSKVKDFLSNYVKFGALGKIEYDSNGDIKNLHYIIRRMRPDGKHEVVRKLIKIDN